MKENTSFRILLVDDNPDDALHMEELLDVNHLGRDLVHVATIASAKAHLCSAPLPDIILLDLWLSDASGLEALRSILNAAPTVPVVVLIGPEEQEVAQHALDAGAQDYLFQGEMSAELLARVLSHVSQSWRLKEELRTEKAFSAAATRNLFGGIAVLNTDGRFESLTPGMLPVLHLDGEEEQDLSAWAKRKIRKKADREDFLDKWRQLLATGKEFACVVEIAAESEERHWSEFRMALLDEEEFVMHGRDVTLDVQTRDQLTFANNLLAKQNEQLQNMTTTDQLTGVLNRSAVYGVAGQQWSRAVRKNEFFSVILMDIDQFQRVNDKYGHLVGDMVLERVGHMLNTLTRPYDLIGRWGGEEFLVILPGTSCEDALVVAERIRTEMAAMDIFVDDAASLKITSCFGVTGRAKQGVAELDMLLQQAHESLAQAKGNGPNSVWQQADEHPSE